MRLDALLPDAPDVFRAMEVTGVTADSRAVAPGFLFFAVAGAKADGLQFAPQALAAGAVAIVGDIRPRANCRGRRSFRWLTRGKNWRKPPPRFTRASRKPSSR